MDHYQKWAQDFVEGMMVDKPGIANLIKLLSSPLDIQVRVIGESLFESRKKFMSIRECEEEALKLVPEIIKYFRERERLYPPVNFAS